MLKRTFVRGGGGDKTLLPTLALLTLAAAALVIIVVNFARPASAQSGGMMLDTPGDEQISGQIVARKLSSGRIEFGWLPSGSDDADRVLPSPRFFPANPTVDKWLSSGSVAGARSAIGHIEARRLHDGRTEFAFTPADQIERIYPNVRYFPADARVGRWLKSSEITFTPGPDDGEMDDGTDSQGGDELDTPTQPPPEPPTTPPATAGNRAISVGEAHNCAIRSSGAIECWGLNTSGQTNAPAGSFTAFSAGGSHTCAIRESGAIECWGSNDYGQTNAPRGSFTAVSAGPFQTCAIRTSGAVECWGRNNYGQTNALSGSFTAISAGYEHTCGLRSSGAIECWGRNGNGQASAPAGSYRAVSAGSFHTCAIRTSGAIECWGWNGVTDPGRTDAPAGSYRAISAGSATAAHTCAIRENGAITCWGYESGQASPPAGTFRAVSTGGYHACGLRSTGAIECWGNNDYGQADPPSSAATPPTTTQPPPEPPTTTAVYSAVSVGGAHTCAIRRSSGAIECWGDNRDGQASPPAGSYTAVSATSAHACGLRSSGAIECWGANAHGQTDAPAGNFAAVSTGSAHTCAIRESGAIECWGANAHGQTDAPAGSYSAISARGAYTCAIRKSGAITCWGSDNTWQTDIPTGSYSAVSVGGNHNCGLRTNGAIECWGLDYEGQITDAPAGRFTTISSGFARACAIRESDGAIVCWGWQGNQLHTTPEGSFSAVSTGSVHSANGSVQMHNCALRSTGAIECWGNNDYGQTDIPSAADGDGSEPERLTNFGEAEGEPMIREGEDGDELGGMSDDGDELGGMSDGGAGDQPTPEPRVGTGTTPLQRDASVTMDSFPIVPTSAESTAYGYIVARLSKNGRVEFGWQLPSGERVLPSARYFPQDPGHDRWLSSSRIAVAGTVIGQINVRRSGDGGAEFAFTPTGGERIEPIKNYFPNDAQVDHWLRTSRIYVE